MGNRILLDSKSLGCFSATEKKKNIQVYMCKLLYDCIVCFYSRRISYTFGLWPKFSFAVAILELQQSVQEVQMGIGGS